MTDAGPDSAEGREPLAATSFRLLGPLEVIHRGEARQVPSGRQQALLAALLLRADEVVPAPALVEQVWGDDADRTVLNVYVMRLRRSLRDRDHELIRAEGNGYRVAVDPSTVDLHRFRRLCESAKAARERGERERERAHLHEALGLWRGDAFAGIASLDSRSEAVLFLEEERLAAIERRIDVDLECGAHADVIRELRQLVADHPFRERFWCQLLLALYRSGRQSEALAAYRSARRRLTEELGVEPGEELSRLLRRVLSSDPTLRGTRSAETVPRVVPAQLPASITGFSGRADQLRRLDRLLDPGEPKPATLVIGPPGVGKTALAVHWAARRRERWPDGQLYVDLRGYGPEAVVRPIEALASFLRAIGVPAEQVPTRLEEASALFRSLTTGRKLLILLDNASATEQVRPLLPGGSDCTVIVTSRDRLTGLVVKDGARLLPLDVLADAEARSLLTNAVGDARLTDSGAVAELARLCGNLPLALRLTAADLIGHPQRSLAGHVNGLRTGNRLDALQVPDDDQAAVRAAFRSSYNRLPEPVRRLFRLLGLFPGPEPGLESAAALAGTGTGETAESLDRLVSAHLLVPRGPDRFAFHDLLRLFATELVHQDDAQDVREAAVRRLYDHYTRTVDVAAKRLYPHVPRLPLSPGAARLPVDFDDDSTALSWLDTELPNLVAAVRYAAEHGDRLDAGRLTASLHGYLYSKMHLVDWLGVVRAGLSAARAIGHARAQVTAHLSLASLHRYQGQPRTAVKHLERALRLSRHDGWIEGQAVTHNNLSGVFDLTGNLELTAGHLYRALELSRDTANAMLAEAVILGNLGRVLLHMGRAAEAVENFERSTNLHHRLGVRVSEARNLASLGEALRVLGDRDRARTLLLEATALQRELDDRIHLPHTMRRLARVLLYDGEHDRAVELATTALALARETGHRRSEPGLHLTLAEADERAGRYEEAFQRYHQADVLSREVRSQYFHVESLIGMGTTCAALGRHGQARHHLDRAVAISRPIGYRLLEEQALTALSALAVRR